MSSDSPARRHKERGKSFRWNRVLVLLAITWVVMMAGIYWIIRSARF